MSASDMSHMGKNQKPFSVHQLLNRVYEINRAFCMGLLALVFCAQISIVILRYFFEIGFIEIQDLVTYSFAAFCVLSIPNALRTDEHVRVDIFRTKQTSHTARRVDLFAIFAFLIPVFALTFWYSWALVTHSWSIFEGSREIGGLPGYFIVMAALPLSCILIILQGLAIWLDPKILHDSDKPQ